MTLPKRKRNRLKNFNYSSNGMYFITICTEKKENLLCKIVGDGAHDVPQVELTFIGGVVEKYILSTNKINGVTVDKFVIMPNHIHMLIFVDAITETLKFSSATNAILPHLVSTFKRLVNKEVGYNIFQRSYHDHIVRGEGDYQKIWEYIDNNPAKWKNDCFYAE